MPATIVPSPERSVTRTGMGLLKTTSHLSPTVNVPVVVEAIP